MDEQKITVVNIVAVSYSGSTWINLMLGAHPDAFSIGEIDWIAKNDAAMCALHGEACPVWSQFDVKSQENPFVQISNITGKKLLIVNNTQRFREAQNDPRIETKYLWVVRDGRAVVASAMRKQPTKGILWGVKFWKKQFTRNEKLIEKQPAGKAMILNYEATVASPDKQMTDVCDFLGIEFHPQMLDYYDTERHFIGGNPGIMSVVANQREDGKLHVLSPETGRVSVDVTQDKIHARSTVDLSHYKKTDPKHFVDERWKSELTNLHLRVFGFLAGRLNRKYGYPPSTQR